MAVTGNFADGPRSSTRRAVLAALLAPPLGAAAYGFLYAIGMLAVSFGDWPAREMFITLFSLPFMAAMVGSLFTYPGMLVVGLPTWLLLRKVRAEGALTYGACGFLGGYALPPVNFLHSFLGESPRLHNAVAGTATALVFWWIARERPSRAAPERPQRPTLPM